jgi:hypothetical protein
MPRRQAVDVLQQTTTIGVAGVAGPVAQVVLAAAADRADSNTAVSEQLTAR